MIKKLAVLITLFGIAGANEISHMVTGNDNLITTRGTNYAFSAKSLNTNKNWKTVSVNGRHVTIISANCQTFKKKKGAYSDKEWALIQQTKTKLETPEIIKSSTLGGRNCLSRYQLIGGGSITTDCSIKETLTSNNGFSVSKQDEDHFSVSKRGLPGELARLFVLGDVIGFVYLDGEVIMKPVACLKKKESKLVKSLRDESHHVSQTVLKNIEADVNFDMGSLEGNLNKETKLNEQSLDAELQDLTKGLDNELGGLLSDL